MSTKRIEQLREGVQSFSSQEAGLPVGIFTTVSTLLRRRQKSIVIASLVSGLLAWLVALILPLQFTATCSFIPPTNSSSSTAAALVGQLSSLGGASSMLGGAKSPGDLYIGILKSRSIADQLIQRFDLKRIYKVKKQSVAEKVLASHTQFTAGTKDTIITIGVTEKDPARARDMANAYLDALNATRGSLALTENSQRRQFFEQRLALEKDELANAEVALKQEQEKSGLISPVGQTSTELGAIAQMRAQMAGKEVQLAALRQYASDENPDVLRTQSELASLRSQIGQMETGKDKQHLGIPTGRVPALALDYVRREREVKYHETLFQIIAKQYEAARLDEAHDPSLQILDRAVVPDTKSGPHRPLIAGLGLILGLLGTILWILLQAARSGEIDLKAFQSRAETT